MNEQNKLVLFCTLLGLFFTSAYAVDEQPLGIINGPGAQDTMERINLICGRERLEFMDENFSCPENSVSQLLDLMETRNQSFMNSTVGFLSQIPEDARSLLLNNHCKRFLSDLGRLFECYNEKVAKVMWDYFEMREILPPRVKLKDCQYSGEDQAPSGLAKLTDDPQGREICQSFADQVKNINESYLNYESQAMIRSSVGIACSVAKGDASIRATTSPQGTSYSVRGNLPAECFTQVPTDRLHQPIPYAPRTTPAIPGVGGGASEAELTSARTGLWPSADGSNSICMIGFNWGQDGRERSYGEIRSEVCPQLDTFDPTGAFTNDIFRVLNRVEATDYLELLRLEAVARTVRSARVQLGNSAAINTIPPTCSGVTQSYRQAMRASLSPSETQRQAVIQSPDHPRAVQAAARRIKNTLVPEVRTLKARDQELSSQERRLHSMLAQRYQTASGIQSLMEDLTRIRNERKGIADRLLEIEYQISADFARYPVLMLDHDPSEKVWDSIPRVDFMADATNPTAAYTGLHLQLQEEIMQQIGKICDPNEISNDQLLGDPELVAIVTARFPRFSYLNQCLQDMRERTQTTLRVLRFGAALGCAAFGPIGGAVCGGLVMITGAYMDYEQAQTRLSYESRCRLSMGQAEEVCSSNDYIAAQTAFNDTIRSIAIDGALEILIPVSLGSLKYLSPSRVRSFNTALEGASSQDDVRRIAREIEEEASRVAARTPSPNPVIAAADDIPVTRPTTVNPIPETPPAPRPSSVEAPTRPNRIPAAAAEPTPTLSMRVGNRQVQAANVRNVDPPRASESIPTKIEGAGNSASAIRAPSTPSPLRLSSNTRKIRNPNPQPPFRADYDVRFPEVNVRYTEDALGDAENFFNSPAFREANPGLGDAPITLGQANELGRGGTRRVFSLAADDSVVVKVYDGSMPGFSDMTAFQRQEMMSKMIQRELAMEDLLLQVVDDYRRMGLEPPFTVARIRRDPDLLSRGIIIQERFTGQPMNTLTRSQLDALAPPPSGYTPPATRSVTVRGNERLVDSSDQFVTPGGVSHSELTRLPGIDSYQRFLDNYDSEIRRVIGQEHGIGLSARSGPNSYHEFGLDYGHGYGNVMFDPDAPAGASQVVIYDW